MARSVGTCSTVRYPRGKIQAAKEFPLAKRNWSKSEVNFIHVAGLNVLPHRLGTAANDVLCLPLRAPFAAHFRCQRDKMKSRSAQHLDWRPWIMRQYESWRMIRWIVTPPASMIVRPFPTGPNMLRTKDEGTETFHGALGEPVIKASFTVLFSQRLAKVHVGRTAERSPRHANQAVIQTLIGSAAKSSETLNPATFTLVIDCSILGCHKRGRKCTRKLGDSGTQPNVVICGNRARQAVRGLVPMSASGPGRVETFFVSQ